MDSLKDCQQKEKALITLEVYFPDEIKELLTELDNSEGKESRIETCRVITVYEQEVQNDDNDELKLYLSDENDFLL